MPTTGPAHHERRDAVLRKRLADIYKIRIGLGHFQSVFFKNRLVVEDPCRISHAADPVNLSVKHKRRRRQFLHILRDRRQQSGLHIGQRIRKLYDISQFSPCIQFIDHVLIQPCFIVDLVLNDDIRIIFFKIRDQLLHRHIPYFFKGYERDL